MAASLTSSPASPASCYRPLVFRVARTDPAGTLMEEIFIADAGDVSALANGLEVGDVVMKYTGSIFGGIPVVAGQTIILDADCGPYKGVQMVANAFDDGGDHYAVIDALDQGDFTPATAFVGSFKVWLNNYTIFLRTLIYTDPMGSPQTVDLKAQPDTSGICVFHANNVIKDYFSHRIDTFMGPVPGGGIVQNAHGVTALFYRVHIAEVYDVPGETAEVDPFDGDHDVHVDDVEDVATFRVAVNAVHPYAGALLDWSTAGMGQFIIGGTGFSRNVLTNAPRGAVGAYTGIGLTLGTDDHFKIHMLTDVGEDYGVDYTIRVFNMDSGSAVFMEAIAVALDDPTSSVSIAIGPADLAGDLTVPGKYRLYVSDDNEAQLSEIIEITVDSKCRENERPFAWLNKLGGVDLYTFRGREISTSKTRRAGVRKPYASGTGFDYTERQYRAEPQRSAMVSTLPVSKPMRKWIVEDMTESPNVNVMVEDRACTCVALTDEVISGNSGPLYKPVTIEYRLGVDNFSQQA